MPSNQVSADEPGGSSRRPRRGWIVWPSVLLAAWAVGGVISFATSLRAYTVPTASMAPAIQPGDRVGVVTQPTKGPRRGEIWVFHMPPASRLLGSDAVKRVIGLPGETIEVAGGRVLINGVPTNEPYLRGPIGYAMPPVTLGPNEYFVLGDSRAKSHDSHVWGPLPGDCLVGPVKVRYWPIPRAGRF